MAGRRPKSPKLRLLGGDPTHGKAPPANKPAPPIRVSPPALRDTVARSAWQRLHRILGAAQLLTDGDRDCLALYADAWSLYVEARAKVAELGAVFETHNGNLAYSPWLAVEQQAFERCRRLLLEMGLTPASRAKVAALEVAGGDPFAALVGG